MAAHEAAPPERPADEDAPRSSAPALPDNFREQMLLLENAVQLFALGTLTIDLPGLRRTVELSHTLGPILDPTKYQRALSDGRLDQQAELLDAVAPLLAYVRKRLPEGLIRGA